MARDYTGVTTPVRVTAMKNDRLNVGMIGAGNIAVRHIENLRMFKDRKFVHSVGFNQRYAPSVDRCQELIDGRPVSLVDAACTSALLHAIESSISSGGVEQVPSIE